MKKNDLTPELLAKCREMAKTYGRVKKEKSGQPEEPEKLQKA